MDDSGFTLPYAYDEQDATDDVFRIQAPASICLDDDDDDVDGDNDSSDEPETLWTHVFVPEREPAPYAESLVDESEGRSAIGEEDQRDELTQPPV